jgi:CheY-like chemotaxis protein
MNLVDARILLVDDEPMLLEIYAAWFRSMGCAKVSTASNGAAALALMESETFDLLLSDIRMPVMDGITLVRCLAKTGRTLPTIVFVSGFGDIDQREMYDLGVEAFVAKPCDRKELLKLLEKAIADRSTLWQTEFTTAPRQSLVIEANRIDTAASMNTIGLGRGGFSVYTPASISLGKVAFRLHLADVALEIAGQGYIRWFSRTENKGGIELAFLNPNCRTWLTDAIASESPRSFIPGS